jgi:hypothetical protein
VSAVAYYRVADPIRSVVAIENVSAAIDQMQLRNLQTLVEIAVDKNSTVVFPAPLMSTIQELGAFMARETAAAGDLPGAPVLRSAPNGATDGGPPPA